MLKRIILSVSVLAIAGTAFAIEPDKAIKTRQAAYTYLGWNMGRIKDNLEGKYNKAEVIQAAKTIAAIANSGMGALYVPGSEKNVGNVETYVKPEFFSKPQDAAKVAQAFNREASEIARVAESGDAAAVKAQFGKLGGTCKSCHDNFRQKW